jgi:hypothetical protein
VSWPSQALPAIQTDLSLSDEEVSQAAAIMNIGAAIVPFLVGKQRLDSGYISNVQYFIQVVTQFNTDGLKNPTIGVRKLNFLY